MNNIIFPNLIIWTHCQKIEKLTYDTCLQNSLFYVDIKVSFIDFLQIMDFEKEILFLSEFYDMILTIIKLTFLMVISLYGEKIEFTFAGHSSWVYSLAVLQNNDLACGSWDNTIKF
ncbi:hypothetical protein BpHYR1_003652 [Brachionus plicatilis]|uniref:Uncharacterized protein n=1 Tax=Brachionus plicatilis TaxID=10195 RepID=A0A3M7QZ06_BRAPC|nr:hypothetical protein BpHYR1_003652 [Brachionus plicatilis]